MAESTILQSIARDWHPDIIAMLLWVEVAYLLLVGPIRRRFRWGPPAARIEVFWFSLGLFVAFLAEATPLHVLSEVYLFSAHMVQHVLLTLVMPPLLILGSPKWFFRPFLARSVKPLVRGLTSPLVALVLFNGVYTLWHLPALYEAALYNHDIHVFQHIVMIATSLIMWWPVLSPLPELPRLFEPGKVLYVFFMSVAQIGAFAVITFSNHLLYEFYARAPRLWGITPAMDQQLAGIVMKIGGMAVFLYVLSRSFFRWAKNEETPAVPQEG